MLQPLILVCVLSVLMLINVNESQCRMSRCVVVAPRSIRSNSDYALSITTHGAADPLQFRVKIYEREEPRTNRTLDYKPKVKSVKQDPVDTVIKRGPTPKLMKKISEDKYSVDVTVPITNMLTKTVTVQPDTPQIVKFKFDRDLQPGSFVLEIVSMSSSADSAFYEKQFLYVETEAYSIFIHPNKASYQPGDTCKYRIVVIDADTRPIAIDSSLTISVYDSARNLVHTKTKQSAKKGVYSGEYQIPSRGKQGVWQIEAVFKNKQIRKQIEVTKAERPNFQVIARTPAFVSNNSTQFSVGVECFYSFGKPVEATAVVKATPILQSSNSWTETAKPMTITKDVRGTSLATFQMSDFKIPTMRTWDSILVETTVQEKATGRVVRGHDKTILVDYKRIPSNYAITFDYVAFFIAGETFFFTVFANAKNGMALPADMQTVQMAVAFDGIENSTYTTYNLDASGQASIIIQVPVSTKNRIDLKVRYGVIYEQLAVMAKQLHLQVLSLNNPPLLQKIYFLATWQVRPAKLYYYVVGRGNVLVSQVIDLAINTYNIYDFDYTPTMAPTITLVAYYVTDAGDIISDATEYTFEAETIANPLTVMLSETRLKPNQELTLTMETGENSTVVLTGVDQNNLLEGQGNDLSRNKVYNELRLYDNAGDMDLDASFTDLYNNMLKPGTFVLTNAMAFKPGTLPSTNITNIRRNINFNFTSDLQSNIVIPLHPTCSYINLTVQEQLDLQNTSVVRSKFDDTWLWQDVEYANGVMALKTTVPDTVTSWMLTGYSLSATTGIGSMPTPIVLTTFKPFFVDIRIPSSCKMGDVVDVQVIVHNYMGQVSRVEVFLDDTAGSFDVIPTGREFGDYIEYDAKFMLRSNLKQTTFQVIGDGVRSTTFSVKPKIVGPVKIKVKTLSEVACDTVEKFIMVEPPGKTISRTMSTPIFIRPGQGPASSVLEIKMPPNAVPGSKKVQVTVQGDKYSLELENRKPFYTDGSDTLTSLVAQGTNILGAAALAGCPSAAAGIDFLNRANTFLKSQCPDGGFRIDGDCDQPLRDTTYTARTLQAVVILVKNNLTDPSVALRGFDWLASVQRADGSFPNPTDYPLGYVEGPITTSYVLLTFLYGDLNLPGLKIKHAATISKAMDNLFAQLNSLDVLSLAFLCRSTQLNQDPRKSVALSRLSRMSFKNEVTQRWTRNRLIDEALPYIFETYQIETDIAEMFRIFNGMTKYLVEYNESMATDARININGNLDLFAAISSTLIPSSYRMKVTFSTSNSTTTPASPVVTTVVIDSTNRTLLSTFELPADTTMINLMAVGSGLANVELTYEYNLMPADIVDAYSLQLTLTSAMSKEWQLNVCVSSKLTPYPTASVMEIKFPPGFVTTEFVQDHDAMTLKITKKDLKGDTMTVKFEGLDDQQACFLVPLYRTTFAEQPLVGTVTIQDMDLKNEKPHISSAEYTLSSFDSMEIV